MERIRRTFVAALAVMAMLGAASAKTLIPGGQSIGVAVRTAGVVVIGASDVGTAPSPAYKAGLRSGDVITKVNGTEVESIAQIGGLLAPGQNELTYVRGGDVRTAVVEPVNEDGALKLGAWVRDSAAGVGTLTYYDPDTGRYGALGHPVNDADAGIVLPVEEGTIYENSIIGVEKGERGMPGEILGQFYGNAQVGDVDANNELGIFGDGGMMGGGKYPQGLETANKESVRPGQASILTTVDENGMREFECEIVRIDSRSADTNRSFTIRVTDEELIGITGGIVQGMSGSPILQDGKLVGAVTHVYVDDPRMGYGVFIENMLEAAA